MRIKKRRARLLGVFEFNFIKLSLLATTSDASGSECQTCKCTKCRWLRNSISTVDTADLCSGLRGHQTDRCELWSFTEAPYFKYGVFVGHESRIILGCIRGVDDRLITPETRIELWGEITPDSGE